MNEKTLAMADIAKLNKTEATAMAVQQDRSMHRAFIVIAKILAHLQLQGKAGDDKPGAALVKAGVRKTTIDNARPAAKVWDLVVTGKLTEEKFDSMSRMDFLNFNSYATTPAAIATVCAAKSPAAAIAKLIPSEVVAKKEKVKAAKKAAGKKAASESVQGEIVVNGETVDSVDIDPADDEVGENVTPEPAPEKITPISSSVPSESDLLELIGQLEKGVIARSGSGADCGSIFTRLHKLYDMMYQLGITPAPETEAVAA
jgi:hypothetical protein